MTTTSLLADTPQKRRSGLKIPYLRVPLLILAILAAASYYSRNDTSDPNEKYYLSELVSNVSKGKAVFVSSFDGPKGMTGLVIKGNSPTGKKIIAWHYTGTDVLVMGKVVNEDGQDLTTLAAQTHIQSQTMSTPGVFQPENMGSYVFKEGQGGEIRQLYIVVSPSCGTCQKILQKLNAPETVFKKDVQVSLIPVGQRDQDVERGARLLETGFFAGSTIPNAQSIRTVESNTRQFFENAGTQPKVPMLLHEGEIITSFSPFLAPPNQGRTAVR